MRKIDIRITKAQIKSFIVTLEEDAPEVQATIGLYTENMKEVSDFTISTRSWATVKFDLPVEMVFAVKDIAAQLERIVTMQAQSSICLLGAPE